MTMTGTYFPSKEEGQRWGVVCRCDWAASDFRSQDEAREAGDRHLEEANDNG
jgi:hypothetical protein